jgi:ankyrin repeat protein
MGCVAISWSAPFGYHSGFQFAEFADDRPFMSKSLTRFCLALPLAILPLAAPAEEPTQAAATKRIDFRTDVAPILQQYCVDCHNADMQMAELRFDQREFVLEDDGRGLVKPGHSADSLLIQRLVDPKLGILMPPTFPFLPGEKAGLAAEKIEILRAWIDQGANWPEGVSLATEVKSASSDPQASALFAAIRAGDRPSAEKLLNGAKSLVAARDKHGATPLIHAATYADANLMGLLLDRGADANAANDDGATALHRSAGDVEKVRLLVKAGAKVNAATALGRTPLLIAASYAGNVDTVKLLLAHGAKIDDKDSFQETCLTSAAKRGDAKLVKVLAAAGADLMAGSRPPLVWAAEEGNVETIACLLECGCGKIKPLVSAALGSAAARGPLKAVELLLESGADPNAPSPMGGYTPLMLAAYSENVSAETVELLLKRGADPKAKAMNGETPLSLAIKRGNTAIVELLKKAGAKE